MEVIEGSKGKIYRLLIVDDDPFIHRTYQTILTPRSRKAISEAALNRDFTVDYAESGETAVERCEALKEQGEEYSVAFVDMSLGLGMDGIQTIKKLWQVFPRLEVVFCTGNDDLYWKDKFIKISDTHRLVVLKKPFDTEEVRQLARSLTAKWDFENSLLEKLKKLESENS